MNLIAVLTDGDYLIEWHGGKTFNVFTVKDAPSGFYAAQQEARKWWYTQGGKGDTQQIVRES